MKLLKPGDPGVDLVNDLLHQVHEHSGDSPERTPFWRDGQWRCEFYKYGSPRLKVFQGEVCIHEEFVQGKATPEDRCTELRRLFTQGPES